MSTRIISALSRLAAVQEQTRQLATSGTFIRTMIALLSIDAILITLHTLRIFMRIFEFHESIFDSRMFAITRELGYGEMFGYLKVIVIIFCFLAHYLRDRKPVFLGLSFAFVVIVLDDSLQIHERVGTVLVAALALEPVAGLRPQDLGELMAWFALGAVVVAALAIGFLRSDVLSQNVALIFLGLLAVLVFFAVGVDMAHSALADLFRGADILWALLEEGGEMVTLSVITAAAVSVVWRGSSGVVRHGPSSKRPLP